MSFNIDESFRTRGVESSFLKSDTMFFFQSVRIISIGSHSVEFHKENSIEDVLGMLSQRHQNIFSQFVQILCEEHKISETILKGKQDVHIAIPDISTLDEAPHIEIKTPDKTTEIVPLSKKTTDFVINNKEAITEVIIALKEIVANLKNEERKKYQGYTNHVITKIALISHVPKKEITHTPTASSHPKITHIQETKLSDEALRALTAQAKSLERAHTRRSDEIAQEKTS